MAVSTPSHAPLGFLDIPAEVRVDVYQHLFDSSELSLEPAFPSVSHCGVSICPCRFPHALLNTCRTLRQEALSYLLAATTLHLSSTNPLKLALLPPTYLASIPRAVVLNIGQFLKHPLDFARLPALRTLELRNIVVSCRYHDERDLCGDDVDELMVNLAMFNIKRHSARLAGLCVSAERPFNVVLHCRFVVSSARQETLVRATDSDRSIALC